MLPLERFSLVLLVASASAFGYTPPPGCNGATSNGLQVVHEGDNQYEVWCDVVTDPGQAWRLKSFLITQDEVSSPDNMRQFCESKGFPAVGKGVEQMVAWLVAKRYLHESGVGQSQINWANAAFHMAMPVWQSSPGTVLTIEENNATPANLPTNQLGDRCDSGQQLCGYWFNNGWVQDDMTYPDPEDWTPGHWTPISRLLCIQTE